MSPADFECIVPILCVRNLERSAHHYVSRLGFVLEWMEPDEMASVSRDGKAIMLCQGGQGQAGTWVWIGVKDVERLPGA